MPYSDDPRQPLLGAGRSEKADGPAPPSYTAFAAEAATADVDVEDGPGEAFFSSPANGGVAGRAGFLSSLLPGGRRDSHHHYYYIQQQQPQQPGFPPRRHRRRSCCRSLCLHLCCFALLALLALYATGVSLGLVHHGFKFWGPSHKGGGSDGDLPPLSPGAPRAPAHGPLPSHPAPPARVTLPPPSPSAPLAGALFMPGRQCRAHNGGQTVVVIPATTYDVAFGPEAALAVEQNVTRFGADATSTTSFLDPLDADVAEMVDGHLRRVPVQVYGDVVVRRSAGAGAGHIEIEALANDERVRAEASFDADVDTQRQRLAVTVDDGVWEDARGVAPGNPETDPWPCLVVRATVWVPENATPAELRRLEVQAVHLGVVVGDDVALAVREHIRLASVVGDVDGHYDVAHDKASPLSSVSNAFVFDAPYTLLSSTTGHIHGVWSRRNRLVASTETGDLAVAVRALPRVEHHSDDDNDDEDKEHAGLAMVVLDTQSGNIALSEVAGDPAAPPHRLVVKTKTGKVSGEASFAQYAGLHSVSGPLAPRLTAVRWSPAPGKPAVDAYLGTDTVSGATDLTVVEEAGTVPAGSAKPLDFLRANHRAVSGAVTLHYPAAWAGHIELLSRFGSAVAVHGDGVVEVPTGPHGPPFGKRLIAEKDVVAGVPEKANIAAATVTGAVDLWF